MSEKTLIIMRGLPWCGKSTRAKELAGENGVIFSTDEYWYTVNHPERPEEYSFNHRFIGAAHKWNQLRAQRQFDVGHPLVIIDNTNTLSQEAKPYVEYAHFQDYKICIEEPTSPRWLEIRELLLNKKANKKKLKEWAEVLAEGSTETHSVPFWTIERMMWRWENNISLESILAAPSIEP